MNQISERSLKFRLPGLFQVIFISLSLCLYSNTSAQCIVPQTDCNFASPICPGQCYKTSEQSNLCCPNFCGPNTIIHNPTYFILVPDCEFISIQISPSSCDGVMMSIQAAILTDCPFTDTSEVLACLPDIPVGDTLILEASVVPGMQYWLMVDGSNFSQCYYEITSVSCSTFAGFEGVLDSLVLSDSVACQGDLVEAVLLITGEDYPSFFFSTSWSADTIKTVHKVETISIPQDLTPGKYEICAGFVEACSGEVFSICDSISINSYIQGVSMDTLVCLENGDLTFTFEGHVFDQSGSYLVTIPNMVDSLCDTAFTLNLTLYPHAVSINEVQVKNVKYQDEAGDLDPWIELYNKSPYPQDLSGFYLSDDLEELHKWSFPQGTIIPAEGYLIVWADNETEEGDLHAGFTLLQDGGTVFFTNPCENTLESTQYLTFRPGASYGRFPNGSGTFFQRAPTFEMNNESTPYNTAVLNEFLAINTSSESDESGEFENWLELYVRNNNSTSLYGAYLTDDPDDITKHVILDETFYGPDSYITFWLDNELEEGENHIGIAVDPEKGYLALYDSHMQIIDAVNYLKQFEDYSFARLPNGVGNWFVNERTYGFSNDLVPTSPNIGYPDLTLSPNPVKDVIYLSNLPDHPVAYTITDLHGRIVESGKELHSRGISVERLTSGIYFIQISGNQIETRRFLKM